MELRRTYNEIVRLQAELDELHGLEFEGAGVMARQDADPSTLRHRIAELKRALPAGDVYRCYGSVSVAA